MCNIFREIRLFKHELQLLCYFCYGYSLNELVVFIKLPGAMQEEKDDVGLAIARRRGHPGEPALCDEGELVLREKDRLLARDTLAPHAWKVGSGALIIPAVLSS